MGMDFDERSIKDLKGLFRQLEDITITPMQSFGAHHSPGSDLFAHSGFESATSKLSDRACTVS